MTDKIAKVILSAFLAAIVLTGGVWAGVGEQPGERFEIKPEDLPEPYATKSVAKFPGRVERGDHELTVADGFVINVFAEGMTNPRSFAIAPNGDVFVSEPRGRRAPAGEGNKITVLRDEDGDGVADVRATFADGFDLPQGMAFIEGALLVADIKGVWRLAYEVGALSATSRQRLTPENALGEKTGSHWQRNLATDPDGQHMYVSVGSTGNIIEDPVPHATVQRFKLDGSGQTTFASGLRNPSALAIYPGTSDLYTVVNERDGMGDELVPDYLTRISDGQFFGWPYAYTGGRPQPDFADKRPDLVAQTDMPDVLFAAHSAPVGLTFYTGDQFPEDYRGQAFVSLHGSWNRSSPTGFKVVLVRFKNGRPAGGYENFVTGWLTGGADKPESWGRPAGLAVASDGSLLIADDSGGTVWRVTYTGE